MKDCTASVPLHESAGQVAFSAIVPYPPGVPMLWPGEVITSEIIDLLEELLDYGYSVYGIEHSLNVKSGKVLYSVSCISDDSCR